VNDCAVVFEQAAGFLKERLSMSGRTFEGRYCPYYSESLGPTGCPAGIPVKIHFSTVDD